VNGLFATRTRISDKQDLRCDGSGSGGGGNMKSVREPLFDKEIEIDKTGNPRYVPFSRLCVGSGLHCPAISSVRPYHNATFRTS
jgi:hypothetical protein